MIEIVICSAVIGEDGTIMRGYRHYDCIRSLRERGIRPAHTHDSQGFITSSNRFVTRKEGCEIQKEAGIESVDKKFPYMGGELYSEDLY